MAHSKTNLLNQVNGYLVGAKATIEAVTGLGEGSIGYATDTDQFGSYNGAAWVWGAVGSAAWGSITGTLSSQTDLQSALNAKLTAANNLSDITNPTTARSNIGFDAGVDARLPTSISGAANDTSPVDANSFAMVVSGVLHKITWANIKAAIKTYLDTFYQPSDSELTALAGLTSAADKAPYFTGSGTAALADLSSAGRALIDDADAAAQRTTLGLGTAATHANTDYAAAANGVTNGDTHNHVGGDGANLSIPIPIILHGNDGTVGASPAVAYATPGLSGIQATTEYTMVVPYAGTMKNLSVRTSGTQPASGSLVATLRKGGADTALVVTIPLSSGAGTYSDSTHSVALVAGDLIDIRFVNNASATSCLIRSITMEFDVANI